jgi:hypothetical protein
MLTDASPRLQNVWRQWYMVTELVEQEVEVEEEEASKTAVIFQLSY